MITRTAAFSLFTLLNSANTFATESIAFQLDVYPECTGCHTNGLLGMSDNQMKQSLMPAAKTAYNLDKRNLSGLKDFLANAASPVVPVIKTCVLPQILNTATNSCVTTAPVVPTCKSTETLTNNVCVTKTVTPTIKNTKPVLNAVAPQWDATVDELISIPLSVKDAEQDEFKIVQTPIVLSGTKLSKVHQDAAGLPSIDFEWTPKISQVNKIQTITFYAKETKTTDKYASNKVSVKVRVWAAGNRDLASITKLNVMTSKWEAGQLNLEGNVVFNNLLTSVEKQKFIAQKFDLTVNSGKSAGGTLIGATPLTLDKNGNWTVSLPVKLPPCDITLQFNGQNATRTVVGCFKPVATAHFPVVVANNGVSFTEEENDDDKHEHHAEGHDD